MIGVILGSRLWISACSFAVGWLSCHIYQRQIQGRTAQLPSLAAGGLGTANAEHPSLVYARQHPDEDVKMVFAVRNDLKMNKGKIAAQVAHAAVDAVQQAEEMTPELLETWEECGCTKVCLKVNSEQELLDVEEQCIVKGLVTSLIEDAGRTQIEAGSKTVCGVGPAPAGLIDAACGHLKLL